MKILHTSDWHLGQHFFTKSRKTEHEAFIQWLLEMVQTEGIDAIIIAGDVFDTGTPPSYAREIYNRFVVELHALNCTLVVLGGNHDSVSVLNESKALLACLNTHVIANTATDLDAQVIDIPNKQGGVGAIVCAIPFIRPRDVVQSQAGEDGVEKRQALGDAITAHYHAIYDLAVKRRDALLEGTTNNENHNIPIIATGHLSALGVSQSDSVRDIYIGTLDGFDAKGFPPADYIALGHIHKPQKVAKSDYIRYCGSPIPLSFDEVKTQKHVLLVEFEPKTWGEHPFTPNKAARSVNSALTNKGKNGDHIKSHAYSTKHADITELAPLGFGAQMEFIFEKESAKARISTAPNVASKKALNPEPDLSDAKTGLNSSTKNTPKSENEEESDISNDPDISTAEALPKLPIVIPIDVPLFRDMRTIKGDLEHIETELNKLAANQNGEENDKVAEEKEDHEKNNTEGHNKGSKNSQDDPIWLSIEVESQDYLSDLQERIATLCEGINVDVLQLRRSKNQRRQLLGSSQAETLAELTPEEVFEKRLNMESFETDEEQARKSRIHTRFQTALEAVQHTDELSNAEPELTSLELTSAPEPKKSSKSADRTDETPTNEEEK